MQISEYKINTSKRIQPIRIALVADLHGNSFSDVINTLKNKRPDIITIVGDIIKHDNDAYPIDFFELCASVAPTFFSLGNHERKITSDHIKSIQKTGVVVLDNSWTKWNSLIIGGMTSAFVTEWRETKKTVLKKALPNTSWLDEFEMQKGFKVLLDHHPENYQRITYSKDIDLVLSGHAHGGQIRILGQGLYAPHQGFFPKYTSGVPSFLVSVIVGALLRLIKTLGCGKIRLCAGNLYGYMAETRKFSMALLTIRFASIRIKGFSVNTRLFI